MKIKDIIANCFSEKEGNAMTRHNLNNYIDEKIENLKIFMKKEEVPVCLEKKTFNIYHK